MIRTLPIVIEGLLYGKNRKPMGGKATTYQMWLMENNIKLINQVTGVL